MIPLDHLILDSTQIMSLILDPNLKFFKRKHHLTTRILITRVYFCQRGLVYKTSFLLKIWLILIFLRKKKCNLVSFHEIPFSIWESETIQKRWQLLNSMNYFQNSERPMIPKFKPKKKKNRLSGVRYTKIDFFIFIL